jgi:hypothetical protein
MTWSYADYRASIKAHGVGDVEGGYWQWPDGSVSWLDPNWRENPNLGSASGIPMSDIEADIEAEIERRRADAPARG